MIPIASIHQQHMLKQQQQHLNMNSSTIQQPQLHSSSIFAQEHNLPTIMHFNMLIHILACNYHINHVLKHNNNNHARILQQLDSIHQFHKNG